MPDVLEIMEARNFARVHELINRNVGEGEQAPEIPDGRMTDFVMEFADERLKAKRAKAGQ